MDVVLPVTMLTQLSRSRFTPFEFASVIVARINLDMFPAINQCQAYRPIFFPKGEDSGIVIRRCWLKSLDRFVLLLCGFSIDPNSCTDSYSLVCAQLKLISQVLIDLTLNRGFAGNTSFNNLIGIVATIRKRLQQSINLRCLLDAWSKLANYGQHLFHESKNLTCDYVLFYTRNRADPERLTVPLSRLLVFPPCAEATGLLNLGGLREFILWRLWTMVQDVSSLSSSSSSSSPSPLHTPTLAQRVLE